MSDTLTYHIPDDRLYAGEQHLWVRRDEGTGRAVVGIGALGLAAMGDLAYIALRSAGTTVRRGEPLGSPKPPFTCTPDSRVGQAGSDTLAASQTDSSADRSCVDWATYARLAVML
jgi:hypothetical protein